MPYHVLQTLLRGHGVSRDGVAIATVSRRGGSLAVTKLTYREVLERVLRISLHFQRPAGRARTRHERIALLSGNCSEVLELLYGLSAAGALVVPLNVRWSAREVERALADARPTLLLVHPLQREKATAALGGLPAASRPEEKCFAAT